MVADNEMVPGPSVTGSAHTAASLASNVDSSERPWRYSQTMANSSPPMRATTSRGPTAAANREASTCRISSPSWWP